MADGQAHINAEEEDERALAEHDAPAAAVAGGAVAQAGAAGVAAAAEETLQLSPLERMLLMTSKSLKWQMEESAKRDAKDAELAKKADAENARREEELQQTQIESTTRGLKDQRSKETAQFILSVAQLANCKERTTLAKAYADMQQALEQDQDDIEEANRLLRVAIKKVKSLTGEKQDDLLERLKVKKRKAPAGSGHCSRCGRDTHATSECYSSRHANGSSLAEVAGGRPAQRPARTQPQGSYAAAAGYAAHFGAAAAQQMYATAPAPQPQQPGPVAAAPAFGQQQQGPQVCYLCGQPGHRRFECPRMRLPMNQPPVAQPGVPGLNLPRPQVSRGWVSSTCDPREEQESERAVRVEARQSVGRYGARAADTEVVNVAVESECSSEKKDEETADSEEESIASMYANTEVSWSVEDDEAVEPNGESEGPQPRCTQPQHMYVTTLSSATPHSRSANHTRKVPTAGQSENFKPAMLEENVALEYVGSSAATMAKLAASGVELATGSMHGELPVGTQSLRGAIQATFAGKKKLLSEEEVKRQECMRCKKTGHTATSCPDQVQGEEEDKTEADAWVRRLMTAPTPDVATLNSGLELEECVRRWVERGEKLNEGNPWEGSTRREDSLRRCLGYHKAMGMSSVHIGWIGFGVPLKFIQECAPQPLAFRNHKTAEEEAEFVDKEHAASVADGSYVEVPREMLKGVCPLQVVKHPVSGKRRLVQDLRWINGHVPNVKFRMESLHKELGDVVRPGDKLMTTDIAKAYYCLAMHPDAQRFLGWMWRGKFYMPTCLVFGLSSAPRIFTKIMRPMMAFMRSAGVRVLGMIDDYLWADTPERIEAVKSAVLTVLPKLGWTLNEKCELTPQDEVLMLGMLVNAEKSQVRAPKKKVDATQRDIAAMLSKQAGGQRVTIQDVQRVTGRLLSMMLAYEGVRVFTRGLYQGIAVALEGNEIRRREGARLVYDVQLTQLALNELAFWQERLISHNGHEIDCRETQVEMVLWSDASDVGYGGEAAGVQAHVTTEELPTGPVQEMAFGDLPREEIKRSSTRRELVGLLKVASTTSILPKIAGKRVKVVMDSIPALRNLIKGGGPVPELCAAVREWVLFCEKHAIRPVYEWVAREGNWRADEASKLSATQHTFKHAKLEGELRQRMNAISATQWQPRTEYRWMGKVAVYLPMFHQVDARVEMIRSQLLEAIIVVPRWPAGGSHDWYRRVVENSIAKVPLGRASEWYKERPQTGHDDHLEAFWLMGRRGEAKMRVATC